MTTYDWPRIEATMAAEGTDALPPSAWRSRRAELQAEQGAEIAAANAERHARLDAR